MDMNLEMRGLRKKMKMTKWQRWERGVRRRSFKALPPPFRIRGFLGNHSHDLRPNSPQQQSGLLPGLSRNRGLYRRYISAICYGSPNIR